MFDTASSLNLKKVVDKWILYNLYINLQAAELKILPAALSFNLKTEEPRRFSFLKAAFCTT